MVGQMEKSALIHKLNELKKKQKMIESAWKKAGNRELLQFFVEIMPKVVEAERCSIFIHDPTEDNLWVQCGTGVEERQISVPQSGSVIGRAIASGKPVFEKNMHMQMGPHDTVALKTGYVTYNTLCVPVFGVTTEKVTGAIQVVNKRRADEFNEADLAVLKKLAFHIQMHIENIYLRQELSKISVQMSKKVARLEKQLAQMGGH